MAKRRAGGGTVKCWNCRERIVLGGVAAGRERVTCPACGAENWLRSEVGEGVVRAEAGTLRERELKGRRG